MGYFKSTLIGMSWTSALRGAIRISTLIRTVVLARLLTPAQFGAYGVSNLALGLLEIFTETGINTVLLQEKTDWKKYINTAWVISIIRGILISSFILIASPIISNFFHAPDALNLLYLTALIPFFRGFINPASIRFQKDLRFSLEFFYRALIITIETAVVLIWAFISHDPASLVWGLIISAVVEVCLSFLVIRPRPVWKMNSSQTRYILSKGKWVTGFGIADYIYSNGDNIAVGRLLGQSALGIYQNAYKISLLPLIEFMTIFYKVTFPVFTHMLDYPHRLKKAALKSALLLTSLLFFASSFVYLFAPQIVRLLLGNQWLDAIPLVKLLAFLAFVRGVSFSFNSLMMALKKQHYVTIITSLSAICLIITVTPLIAGFGIEGAAIAAIIGATVSLPVSLYLAYKTYISI